ncbi:hypothetical protein COT20_02115 [bacterium (Candidatus Gribaldobacteria) CG08_land_8_20_14_0_20_39_15]|uniref:Uncharacterized protein n=1 Tax=bacterium (Candidatus Gribaldobacteria) CG08_land_8_20_14_0_20_39_15 TaxID=2014273 RepID=A0A2M6XU69_9BACT|nr:MAG: hypothetical protein COT20_02115 [bacterium (Candidatus Gribaldobacteria) CG08_land_8_20_14_0_20_39_15]
MEDDLRRLQGEQAQTVRETMVRGRLKMVSPRLAEAGETQEKKTETLATSLAQGSFLLKLKNSFARFKRKKSDLRFGKARESFQPPSQVISQSSPQVSRPQVVFSTTETKPSPAPLKKGLASGLRLGERIIEANKEEPEAESLESKRTTQPQVLAPKPLTQEQISQPKILPEGAQLPISSPLPVVPVSSDIQPLPDNLRAEPYAIDDLEERLKEKSRLQQEKSELDAKLQVFWPQRRPLELKIAVLREERQAFSKSLSPFAVKDAQLRAQTRDITEKEKKAQSPQERHQLEEQRWALEQQRQGLEKQKWAQEEKIDAKDAEIKAAELQLEAVLTQEADLRQRKEAVVEGLEKIVLAQERLMLNDKLSALDLQRRGLGKDIFALKAEEDLFKKKLEEISDKERIFEAQETSLEETYEKAASFKEKKEIEQNRWRLAEQRKDAEEKRWEIEKKIEKNKEQADILKLNSNEILRKQIAREIRAQEIDILLRQAFSQAENILKIRHQQKDRIEAAQKQEIEIRSEQDKPWLPFLKKTISDEAASFQSEDVIASPKPTPADSEVLSTFEAQSAAKIRQKVEEREKEKKLALIQQRAEDQRGSLVVPKIKGSISKADVLFKLLQISPDEQANRERFLARLAGRTPLFAVSSKKEGKEIIFRPLVKKSSFFEKILARFLFLLIIFAVVATIIALVYFYVILPKPEIHFPLPPVLPGAGNEATTSPPSTSTLPEIEFPAGSTSTESGLSTTTGEAPVIPTLVASTSVVVLPEPLIPIEKTTTLEFTTSTEIAGLLKKALEDNQGDNLNRLIFQTKDQTVLNLPDFLAAFKVALPAAIGDLLETDGLLLVSGQGLSSRFGFIVSVKDAAALPSVLRGWETNMEKDWSGLWSVLGKTKPALTPYFLNAKYKNMSFRYQTFTKQDFGICYCVLDDYFVIATSYAQMKLILEKVKGITP